MTFYDLLLCLACTEGFGTAAAKRDLQNVSIAGVARSFCLGLTKMTVFGCVV